MRSAEAAPARALTVALLAAALAGCSTPPPDSGAPAMAQAVATPPATGHALPPVDAAPTTPQLPPVDPAALRAFDDALRALRAGRHEEPQRALEALAAAHPTLGGVHANLALLHRRAGRGAEAVAALETAVRLSPDQPRYLNELGIAYRETGQFAKAREAYERAIVLDAGYAAPQLNRAILLDLYLGDRGAAVDAYQRSAALMPDDAAQIGKWLAELRNRKPETRIASASTLAPTPAPAREKP